MVDRLALLTWGAILSANPQQLTAEPTIGVPHGQIQNLLSSREPGQLAWGAYLAGESGQRAAVPLLIPLLRHAHPDVQLASIDALIRLRADVPSENLKALRIDGSFDATLVLLSFNPRKHSSVLLDLLDRPLDHTEWTAVSSLLWTSPPPGYAARLLREWKLQSTVEVKDSPTGISCGGSGYIILAKPERDRSGFPPIWHYVLRTGVVMPEATAIADGPHPISFQRETRPRSGGSLAPRHDFRRDYLQSLAGLGLPGPLFVFWWTDTGSYLADAENLRALIRKCMTDLRQALVERGLLDAAEEATSPPAEITVVDRRLDQRIPLPAFQWQDTSATADR